jgi:hypothetical protein
MSFNDSVDKGRGVKSSLEEELNSSMKTENARTLEDWRKVSSTLSSCFTIISTIELIILTVMMFS